MMQSDLADRRATPEQLRRLAQQGQLDRRALTQALHWIGYIPDRQGWVQFFNTMLLALGALFLVSGIFFFFAYNWQDLPRFGRFGAIEAAIVVAVGLTHYLGLQTTPGKIILTVATLLVGALLAVFGQEYQTGADSYRLFLFWALLTLGWVLIGAFDVLWLVLLGLLNLTVYFYFEQVVPFGSYSTPEAIFALNALALIFWEMGAGLPAAWTAQRWLPRLAALAAFAFILFPTLETIFSWFDLYDEVWQLRQWAPLIYAVFCLAVCFFYIRIRHDLLILTIAAMSLIIVITAIVGRALSDVDDMLMFLVSGFAVIVQATVAVNWLRRISRSWEAG